VPTKPFSLSREGTLKRTSVIHYTLINQRGFVMWWELIVSLVLAYPAIEMVEEWRLHRAAQKHLAEMRRHAASGQRWDATKGQRAR